MLKSVGFADGFQHIYDLLALKWTSVVHVYAEKTDSRPLNLNETSPIISSPSRYRQDKTKGVKSSCRHTFRECYR